MQERLADLAADSFGERSLFGIGNVEVSVLVHQRRVLLLLVRDLGGERGKMPVNVRVSLMAAQAEDVKPLGRHCTSERTTNAMYALLHGQILVFGEVSE